MLNSSQYALIAILLSLCLYFALLSQGANEQSFELAKPAMCAYHHDECGHHYITIDEGFRLFLEDKPVTKIDLFEHLKHHVDCEMKSISMVVNEDILAGEVVTFNEELKQLMPKVLFTWASKEK
ncbi:hypothetical protein [Algibacillus agarilyticus]|uniref:hypothetical protein n=1 Tax=Algibacillus agarilyticus TaxID=2234133 RepID=UPI001300AFF1|nr:hypothetical protein [Algibacillus agarilyticus]